MSDDQEVPEDENTVLGTLIENPMSEELQGFYKERWKEMQRGSLPLLNDVLSKCVVLNTALVGVFLGVKDLPMDVACRLTAAAFFLFALGFSFWGLYPRGELVTPFDPYDTSEAEGRMIATKRWVFRWIAVCLVCGLAFGLLGSFVFHFKLLPA